MRGDALPARPRPSLHWAAVGCLLAAVAAVAAASPQDAAAFDAPRPRPRGGRHAAARGLEGGGDDDDDDGPTLEELATAEFVDDGGSGQLCLKYEFALERADMRREGQGELLVAYRQGMPRIRLKGKARTPRFGVGEITLVLDTPNQKMYALFNISEMHKTQCVIYDFPDPAENKERMKTLRWRSKQVHEWQHKEADEAEHPGRHAGEDVRSINWTNSYTFDFTLKGNKNWEEVKGIALREGDRVVKNVTLEGVDDTDEFMGGLLRNLENQDEAFGPPGLECKPEGSFVNPVAEILLKPPHRASSALNDLLLVLADHGKTKDWSELFIMLNTVAVPGDVAVLMEEPRPPDLQSRRGVGFDYEATVFQLGEDNHTFDVPQSSKGTVWLNREVRSFRIQDSEPLTSVGPVYLDLVADGEEHPAIWLNVNLTAQAEQQCIQFPQDSWPQQHDAVAQEMQALIGRPLQFYALAQLREEDCAVFVVELARGRHLYLWVDLEAKDPDAFLQAEVRHDGEVLRRTEILKWHGTSDKEFAAPDAAWRCSEVPEEDEVIDLGLSQPHGWSEALKDTLYALRYLDIDSMVIEILGLAGNVNVVVQREPDFPALAELSSVSFAYLKCAESCATGSVAIDNTRRVVRMTANADPATGGANVSLVASRGLLFVRVRQDAATARCITFPLLDEASTGEGSQGGGRSYAWSAVEVVGESQAYCNRFSVHGDRSDPAAPPQASGATLWYNENSRSVCALQLESGEPAASAPAYLERWTESYKDVGGDNPDDPDQAWTGEEDELGAPASWECPEHASPRAWESQTLSDASAAVLSELAEAAEVVGLLPPDVARSVRALSALSPPRPPVPPPPVGILGPELRGFQFAFEASSCCASEGVSTSKGQLRVDLEGRRLAMHSQASGVSSGLPALESSLVLESSGLGAEGTLRAYSFMSAGGDARCWTFELDQGLGHARDLTSEAARAAPNNPFARVEKVPVDPDKEDTQPAPLEWADGDFDLYDLLLADQLGGHRRHVQMRIKDEVELGAIYLETENAEGEPQLTNIKVFDWSTDPPGGEFFTPDRSNCEELGQAAPVRAREWDLLRVFLPPPPRHGNGQEDQYELSAGGYASPCAVPITSASECMDAAQASGWVWGGPRNWSDRLPGCLLSWEGDVHFNRNQEGVAASSEHTPLCRRGEGAERRGSVVTPLPEALFYELSESPSTACRFPLTSPEACEAAAASLGYHWAGRGDVGDALPACLRSPSGDVLFNSRRSVTGSRGSLWPLCQAQAPYHPAAAPPACDVGIASEEECDIAARVLGWAFAAQGAAGSHAGHPTCSATRGGVVSFGAPGPESTSAPLCKREARFAVGAAGAPCEDSIEDEEACAAAAAALGIAWGGRRGRSALSCWAERASARAVFAEAAHAERAGLAPLCRAPGGSGARALPRPLLVPQATYALAAGADGGCESPLRDAEECRAAALSMGWRWDGAGGAARGGAPELCALDAGVVRLGGAGRHVCAKLVPQAERRLAPQPEAEDGRRPLLVVSV
ncbi:unnamed protein product [Prorocentrum cordatum]|uniref:Uncharacterized protein n=1 Tax=Prorocentrum cordatum TaxID=2364126 RepID=A0ABN9SRT4_9DINO|nr:unnamed protein product [Polarella glacialis]